MNKTVCVFIAILLAGSAQAQGAGGSALTDAEVILKSINAPSECFQEEVEFFVEGSGTDKGRDYLNSRKNYRDKASLNVRIDADAITAFQSEYGMPPREYYKSSCIRLNGTVCQIPIRVRHRNKDGKVVRHSQYYQTQMRVTSLDDIEFCRMLVS